MGGKRWTIQETDQLIELLSRYTDAQIAYYGHKLFDC